MVNYPSRIKMLSYFCSYVNNEDVSKNNSRNYQEGSNNKEKSSIEIIGVGYIYTLFFLHATSTLWALTIKLTMFLTGFLLPHIISLC